jgi:peptide/nickel transport system substrate-binding protein
MKVITVAVSVPPKPLGLAGDTTPTGGWAGLIELHTEGLVTSDFSSRRPIGRLAARVPSLEDGSVTLLPDGSMRVAFPLRSDVFWHDGAPVTAQDLAFSAQIGGTGGMPTAVNATTRLWDHAEAPDDATFVVYYRAPYYLAAELGPHAFWPLPRHLLEEPFRRYQQSGDVTELANVSYWTSDYVHLGAFRLTSLDPGEGATFAAFDRYFLGRPRVDEVRVRVLADSNTLFATLMAGEIDVIPNAVIRGELGPQLQQQWEASGRGRVIVRDGPPQILEPQFSPALQTEPANLDPEVRKALYYALDREALADGVNGGNPQLAAWTYVSIGDPFYTATRDTFREFAYDPRRAVELLRTRGWAADATGALRNAADGRPFHTSIRGTAGFEQPTYAYAGYWQQLGIDVEPFITPAALARDRERRVQFGGWQGTGTIVLERLSDRAATPENRWVGNENGFEDPTATHLVTTLRESVTPGDQSAALAGLQTYLVRELPVLPLYFYASYLAVRKGVRALDDAAAGVSVGGEVARFGTYFRNAYLWDLE